MYAKTVVSLCVKAVLLYLFASAVLVLASLTGCAIHKKVICQLPVAQRPDMFGYQASDKPDELGQRWTYLSVYFRYDQTELTQPFDRFPPDSMAKAQKEGNRWMKCVSHLLKTRPQPLLLVRHE